MKGARISSDRITDCKQYESRSTRHDISTCQG